MALAKPRAAVGSRASRSPETTAPAQPPTPDKTATYCLPSGPRNVVGCPMIPEPVLNCQSTSPVLAFTALNQPSMVPSKVTSAAVASVPLHTGKSSSMAQTFFFCTGSQAQYSPRLPPPLPDI